MYVSLIKSRMKGPLSKLLDSPFVSTFEVVVFYVIILEKYIARIHFNN